jgi:uncharacterized protein
MSEKKTFYNRLVHEKSPYLNLHAHDPIDWYPWCEEAIKKAQEENKPIFLSIGYFTCHWCRQMQKDVFSDTKVAEMLNEYCINIKIDKEEHEEVERLYSRFSQALIGEFVTLPLNIFLTSDLKPFIAKGYIPLESQFGSMGMYDLVEKVKQLWYGEEKEEIKEQADRVVELFEDEQNPPETKGMLTLDDIDNNVMTLFQLVDPLYGGVSSLPKTLSPCHLLFLTRFCQSRDSARSLFYLNRTLESMTLGGVYDLIGGGFSVYGIERKWCIPHFEKLLIDNALMAEVYFSAYFYTENEAYRDVGLKIVHFALEELQSKEGAFHSAISADVGEKEGAFYTWSAEEIQDLLTDYPMLSLFCRYYDISIGGNFEGSNILHATEDLGGFAAKNEENGERLAIAFRKMRQVLVESRRKRVKPDLDTKVVSSANALMVHSLVLAYRASQNPEYLSTAESCIKFIKENLWKDEKLYRRWIEGEKRFVAGLNDYSYMIKALIALFLDTAKVAYFEWACELTELVEEKFQVGKGAYYFAEDQEYLTRQVEFQDRSSPSGNAIHTENLLALYQITNNKKYYSRALSVLEKVSGHINYQPIYGYYHLLNMLNVLDFEKENFFVIFYSSEGEELNKMKGNLRLSQRANVLSLWVKADNTALIETLTILEPCEFKGPEPVLFTFKRGKNVASYEGLKKIINFLQLSS